MPILGNGDGRLSRVPGPLSRLLLASVLLTVLAIPGVGEPLAAQTASFSFIVTADMREFAGSGAYDTPIYFRGACEAISTLGSGAFMVSPGDIDPPANVEWTIQQYLGAAYTWYPGAGNHETETPADMAWLRAYDYGAVNPGPAGCPETTYSFDYQNAHFVMLNEYCDTAGDTATDGDVPDHLYNWLAADLAATDKTHIFVFGHEPAFPQPDADNGRSRHVGDSLDQYPANRDRFWSLLRDWEVVTYITGHTHNYSAVQENDVWQLDAGHSRGAGDLGAPSTFLRISVDDQTVTYEAHRDNHDGVYDYLDIVHSGTLRTGPTGIELASFAATPLGDAVLVTWETAVELDVLGFDLYRAGQLLDPPTNLNQELIPSQSPGGSNGAAYAFVDESITWTSATYYYWLDVIDHRGTPTRYGPVSTGAQQGGSYRNVLPLVLKTFEDAH